MKKIYSLAAMVMMALCAMIVSSCGNDDDTVPSSDPTITAHVSAASVYSKDGGDRSAMETQAAEAGYNFCVQVLQNSSCCKVNKDAKTFTFKASDKAQVKSLLEAASKETLNAELDKITGLTSVLIELTDGNDIYFSQDYSNYKFDDTSYVVGTWKGTVNGETYTLTINNDGKLEDGETWAENMLYSATVVTSSTTFKGTYSATRLPGLYSGAFTSDDSRLSIKAAFLNDDFKQFTALVSLDKVKTEDIIFAKQ